MSFLSKAAGFAKGLGSVFGASSDLESLRRNSESAEFQRLRKLSLKARDEAELLTKEGVGISERPDIQLGHEFDLEDFSREEREFRSTGRRRSRPEDTGLII